ncbi:hypothetical protein FSARC_14113 [Fusarium sarcochroum]|uniref:Uncharacterized protein n=1 Tax=Fusarium sarcochroum TaxID=1208366 RepID=A0A8H4WQ96_9HYPO|nr:hypothetical protein FSARC_14113 [Fusarium sarcochroum]
MSSSLDSELPRMLSESPPPHNFKAVLVPGEPGRTIQCGKRRRKRRSIYATKPEQVDDRLRSAQITLHDSERRLELTEENYAFAKQALERAQQMFKGTEVEFSRAINEKNNAKRSVEGLKRVKKASNAIHKRMKCRADIADLKEKLRKAEVDFLKWDELVLESVEETEAYDLESLLGAK